MLRHTTHLLALSLLLLACAYGFGQTHSSASSGSNQPTSGPEETKLELGDLESRPKLSSHTRLELIHSMNAEFARTLKYLPVGFRDLTLTSDGKINPDDGRLHQLAMVSGVAAKVGDQVQITNIVIHAKSIYFELNGGPKGKSHWYQHVTVGAAGGNVPVGGNNQGSATGAALTLEFKQHVPEITGPELKQLLQPVLDFTLKTATEAYLETVPPKVKEAIQKHEVLVGMNHDMVVMAKDRPPQKLREKDNKGVPYEEWVYGQPPQDVTFVRFSGDEVTQVKVLKVGGEEVLKTEREIDVRDGVVSLAEATAHSISAQTGERDAPQQSAPSGPRPTLKRPGEADDSQHGSQPVSSRPRGGSTSPTDSTGIPETIPGQQPGPQQQPLPPSIPPR